jgi:hypothetical protein
VARPNLKHSESGCVWGCHAAGDAGVRLHNRDGQQATPVMQLASSLFPAAAIPAGTRSLHSYPPQPRHGASAVRGGSANSPRMLVAPGHCRRRCRYGASSSSDHSTPHAGARPGPARPSPARPGPARVLASPESEFEASGPARAVWARQGPARARTPRSAMRAARLSVLRFGGAAAAARAPPPRSMRAGVCGEELEGVRRDSVWPWRARVGRAGLRGGTRA